MFFKITFKVEIMKMKFQEVFVKVVSFTTAISSASVTSEQRFFSFKTVSIRLFGYYCNN